MRKLNVKLLFWSLGLALVLAIGSFSLHWLQSGRIAQALLWRANKAEADGDLDQTMKYLGRYLEFKPDDLAERSHLARTLTNPRFVLNAKLREQAYFNLEQVLTREPDHDDLRRLLVRVTLDMRRFDEAKEQLDLLVKEHPVDGEVDHLLARWHEGQGQFAGAAEWYRKALQHSPGEIDNYFRLAALLRRRLDPGSRAEHAREADQRMDEMVAKNDRSFQAHLARWNYRKEYGALDSPARLKEAAGDVQRALELAPDEADVLLAAADMAQAQQEPDKARGYLNQGQRSHPLHPRMYQAKARLDLQAGKRTEAIACLRKGLAILPTKDQVFVLSDLVELLIDGNDLIQAAEALGQLRKVTANPALADYFQGRMLLNQGRWADAATQFERVRAAWETLPELTKQVDRYLGQCYAQLDEPARQLAAWTRVVSQNPESVPARWQLAAAQVAMGRINDAVDQYRKIVALPNAPPGAWTELVRVLLVRNLQGEKPDWTEVEDALSQAEAARPGSLDMVLLRAEMFMLRKQFDQAETLLLKARDEHPKETAVWVALASLAQRQEQPEKAKRLLDEAEAKTGPSVALRLAQIRYWSNRPGKEADTALEQLKSDLSKYAKDDLTPQLHELAVAFFRLNNIPAAEDLWDRLARQPGYENNLQIRRLLFDLALQRGDEPAMRQRLDDLHRVEGEEGHLWRYSDAMRLLWLGKRGDHHYLDEARRLLDTLAGQRRDWAAVRVAIGEIEDLKGHVDQAIDHYRQALALGEHNPSAASRLIQLLFKQHRYDEADKELTKLKRQAPISTDLKWLQVDVSLRTHDAARALDLARQAVLADSRDYRDFLFLGQVLVQTNQSPAEAEKHFRQAVALAPTVPETWITLVQHLASTRQKEKAEEAIQEAREKLPPDQASMPLGLCYEAVGRLPEANKQYQEALAAKPDDAKVLASVTGFYLRTGRSREAEPYFRRMLDPKTGGSESEVAWARRQLATVLAAGNDFQQLLEGLGLLGLTVDSAGRVLDKAGAGPIAVEDQRVQARILATHPWRYFREKAIRILEDLKTRHSATVDDQMLLADLYQAERAWPKARDLLRNLLADHETNQDFLVNYAQALLRHGEIEDADRLVDQLDDLEKKRNLEPGAFGSLELRALVLEGRGEGERALDVLRQYVGRKRAKPQDVLILIGCLGRQHHLDEALRLCEQAWQTCSAEAVAGVLMTILHTAPPEARYPVPRVEGWLKSALRRQPDSVALRLHLADFLELQENYSAAEDLYRRILEQDPRNVIALNNLAWQQALKAGQDTRALEWIERAIELSGPQASLLDTRAVVHLARGDSAKAIADGRDVVRDAPTATRWLHLARALMTAGDRPAAREALRQARSLKLDLNRLPPSQREIYRKMIENLDSGE